MINRACHIFVHPSEGVNFCPFQLRYQHLYLVGHDCASVQYLAFSVYLAEGLVYVLGAYGKSVSLRDVVAFGASKLHLLLGEPPPSLQQFKVAII